MSSDVCHSGDVQDEQAAAGPVDDAIVLEITPANYRRRALILVPLGIVLEAVGIAAFVFRDNLSLIFSGLICIGYGIHWARQARQQITQTVLRIDRDGLHSPNPVVEHRWGGVVLIWVGPQSGLRLPFVLQPAISVFTVTGVSFAQRAGTRPKALYTVPLGPGHRVPELCARLRTLSSAEVVDGRQISRRAAGAALVQERTRQ